MKGQSGVWRLALPVSFVLSSCISHTLPIRAEQSTVATIGGRVGVEPHEFVSHSEKLVRALRRTGLFDEVCAIDDFEEPPDRIARVLGEATLLGQNGWPEVPFWTDVTWGLIPHTARNTYGFVFSLVDRESREGVVVDYRYELTTTISCLAPFLNFSSDRTVDEPVRSRRFADGLAAQIAAALAE